MEVLRPSSILNNHPSSSNTMSRNPALDVTNALQEKSKGNSALYRLMVQEISTGSRLVGWFSMLSKSVTDISDSHYELLQAIFAFDWFSRLPAEIASYNEFLVHLTFAKANFFDRIYSSLIFCFRGPPQTISASLDEKVQLDQAERQTTFRLLHTAIKSLIEAHPTSVSVLRQIIIDKFPHKVFEAPTQASYIQQILFLTSYVPSLRKDILELVIDRIVQVDVELKNEVRVLKAQPSTAMDQSSEDTLFQFENDPTHSKAVELDENEEKVDVMLETLLSWLSHLNSPLESENKNVLEEIFCHFLSIFDKVLLPTNQTKYAQWSLFYLCSFKEDYVSRFLEHLFAIFQNTKLPFQQRQRSALYIASLTSRASFMTPVTSQNVLNYMCNWMAEYESLQTDSANPEASTHVLFYAMFHGICHILKYIHESLFDHVSAKHTIQALGIVNLVRSRLNPLKVCSPMLTKSFIEIMAKYGFSFTNIIQHNEKIVLPAKDVFGPSAPLSDFFPFDPYLLKLSSSYFIDLYHYPELQKAPSKKSKMDTGYSSGYATEGETEMDMDHNLHPRHHDEDLDDEDAHTTESMMAMMDFGRGSMPDDTLNTRRKPNSNASQANGNFGSFDEKSSVGSGHSSSFSHSGSLLQPNFGGVSFGGLSPSNPFAVPQTPANSGSSPSFFGPNSASHLSSNNTQSNFTIGSLTEPRIVAPKRQRDDVQWEPSTPQSAGFVSPAPHRTLTSFGASSTPNTFHASNISFSTTNQTSGWSPTV